jgi:transcriptional regulator
MGRHGDRTQLLQGTLDMLILRTLLMGPAHGRAIATHIRQTTGDVLQVEHGSLYPALHRLEQKGWLAGKWEVRDRSRELKYYRLTPAGRRQLAREASRWSRLVGAIARVMSPAEGA